jgi:hypothetical protein
MLNDIRLADTIKEQLGGCVREPSADNHFIIRY